MNINRLTLTGRLTRDPEGRELPTGTSVCNLRLAVNGMGRKAEVGFIDVTVYGPAGEACATYLAKGAKVAVDGRIEYGEWETDEGSRRHDYSVVADRGQISRLLSRLAQHGLIENHRPADDRGGPNLWRLTDDGEQAERAIRRYT